jgi:hypothetical protein
MAAAAVSSPGQESEERLIMRNGISMVAKIAKLFDDAMSLKNDNANDVRCATGYNWSRRLTGCHF